MYEKILDSRVINLISHCHYLTGLAISTLYYKNTYLQTRDHLSVYLK